MKRNKIFRKLVLWLMVITIASLLRGRFSVVWEVNAKEREASVSMAEVLSAPEPRFTQVPEEYHFTVEDGVLTKYIGYGGDVEVPAGVTKIGDRVFEEKDYVKSIILPESVTNIGDYAFQRCGLTDIRIPESVTGIGASAFAESNLTNVRIPGNVNRVESLAFYECGSLQNVEITEGVKQIGNYAFWGCRNLSSIRIPQSVEVIGNQAFPRNVVIEGYKGSSAEIYAKESGNSFVNIGKDVKKGDVDGNGNITLEDAKRTLQAALKIEVLDTDAIICADIIEDGNITLADARLILRIALKIESI